MRQAAARGCGQDWRGSQRQSGPIAKWPAHPTNPTGPTSLTGPFPLAGLVCRAIACSGLHAVCRTLVCRALFCPCGTGGWRLAGWRAAWLAAAFFLFGSFKSCALRRVDANLAIVPGHTGGRWQMQQRREPAHAPGARCWRIGSSAYWRNSPRSANSGLRSGASCVFSSW